MKNKEIILFSINLIESTVEATSQLIDFYLNRIEYDNLLNEAINNLLTGYSTLILVLPQILTGRLDKVNLKKELLNSIQEVQIAFVYSEEYPDDLRNKWLNFSNYWKYYKTIILDMFDKERIIQISLN